MSSRERRAILKVLEVSEKISPADTTWLTLTNPVTFIFPVFGTMVAYKLDGFTGIIPIGLPRATVLGTVLIILSSRSLHVRRKKSFDAAIFLISSPPSELKMRASDRVVTLWPNASGFCVMFDTNSVALRRLV